MSKEKFCELCHCTKQDGKRDMTVNYPCPLLGGKNICDVDCHFDLGAGHGAPDTLRKVMTISRKSAWEVNQTCVACPRGGKKVNMPNRLISIRGKNGKQVKSGPEFEAAKKGDEISWKAHLERLKDPNYPPLLPWQKALKPSGE